MKKLETCNNCKYKILDYCLLKQKTVRPYDTACCYKLQGEKP